MSVRQSVADRLAQYLPDCGDNSCVFAPKKGGMRTNGGCRCLTERSFMKSPPLERLAYVQTFVIRELLDEIDRLNNEGKR